ncbi:ribonuclease [Edwardsiella piscicida]|uniref:ribonuclease T2 family protein n=1 Tax=Edwardsiella piscicida TaxID=1263550 RepID=UPI00370D9D0E
MLRIKYFLLLLLLCVSSSLYALDKDQQDLPGLPSGAYDYLVYAVTWQPTFCLLNPAAPGCKAYRADFYTHGIWPYFLSTEQSANRHPSNCIQSPGCPAGSSCALLPGVIDALLKDTAFRKIVSAQPEGLMKHEWSKHGTCLGSDQRGYFTRFTQLKSAVKYDDEFKKHMGQSVSLDTLRAWFPDNVRFRCATHGGKHYFFEAFYLIDRQGAPDGRDAKLQIGEPCPLEAIWIPAPPSLDAR